MSTLLIEGGRRLAGSVAVEGNKNAALPLLAACLLTTEECVLTNVPRIRDVEVMAQLLIDLGAVVDGIGTPTLRVRCPEVVKDEPDGTLVGRLRGSVLLLGPLLARRGRAQLAPPGGDFPARRTITTHLEALIGMGARVLDGPGHIVECPEGLKPTSIRATSPNCRTTCSYSSSINKHSARIVPRSRAIAGSWRRIVSSKTVTSRNYCRTCCWATRAAARTSIRQLSPYSDRHSTV